MRFSFSIAFITEIKRGCYLEVKLYFNIYCILVIIKNNRIEQS